VNTQLDAAIESDLAKAQTTTDKQAQWKDFVARCSPNRPLDSSSNYALLVGVLEKEQKLVNIKNLHTALLANLDYIQWDKSAQIAAQQKAQRDAAAKENAALNQWFANAESQWGLVDDAWNRKKIVDYLTLRFHGIPNEF
jgi:hypothetical protein